LVEEIWNQLVRDHESPEKYNGWEIEANQEMISGDFKGGRTRLFTFYRAVIAVVVLGVVAWVGLKFTGAKSSAAIQPLQFNHKLHVEQEEEPCDSCHTQFKTTNVAGRPRLSACLECHDEEPLSDNPEEAKLVRFVKESRDPPWVRLTRLPPHVRFSHQRHVVVGAIDCTTCHGDFAKLIAPPSNPLNTIDMNFCMDCHRSESFQFKGGAFKALKTAALDKDLVEDMKILQNKRFKSSLDLLAAVEKLSSTPLTESNKQIVLAQVNPAAPVTVDCIACHR